MREGPNGRTASGRKTGFRRLVFNSVFVDFPDLSLIGWKNPPYTTVISHIEKRSKRDIYRKILILACFDEK